MRLYNSLTREKTDFEPLVPGKISLYVCGVTVYDDCHIGHARTYLAFDVIVKYLRYRGYDVTYVRNITDIDDKIIKRATENDETCTDLVARTTAKMHADFDQLGIDRPNLEPRATEAISDMINMISTLIDKGYAYCADNGDVYYQVDQIAAYGKLTGQTLEQMQAGKRVEINEAKRNPFDFVLWKAAKPGEPAWSSPWGDGRPGWHIECSAMTCRALGKTFDIHGGGSDLRFPHHENEIAQSEAANDCEMARYWMHSGMVQVNAEKMSKSLGNFFTISEVLKTYPPEIIRYFLISGHYRSEINYSEENLDSAKAALTRLYTAIRGITPAPAPASSAYRSRFEAAMDDDFNTPEALAVLFDCAREINTCREDNLQRAAELTGTLLSLAQILGILYRDPDAFLQGDDIDVAWIEAKIDARNAARTAKDWTASDAIRDELQAAGIALEDTAQGTTWRQQ